MKFKIPVLLFAVWQLMDVGEYFILN